MLRRIKYSLFRLLLDDICKRIECGCSVKLPKSDTVYNKDEEARQNAINAWNRRAGNEEDIYGSDEN